MNYETVSYFLNSVLCLLYGKLHDRIIVLFYPLDVTSSISIKQLRNRFGDYPKLYIVMSGGDI